MVFVEITRVTFHLVDTVFVSTCITPTVINVSAHLSLLTTPVWKSETQSQLSSMSSSTQLSCGLQLWPSTTQSSLHIHTHSRWRIRSLHHKFRNQSTSQHSRFHPKKTRQSNGTPRLQLSYNIQFKVRVVGHQDANRVLIRVRHRSRNVQWVPFQSVCCAW